MKENIIKDKTKNFALRIIKLYKYLVSEKKEQVLSKQILKSGTSIGANVKEGIVAYSKPEFYSKMSIALKEANETYYWLRLLCKTDYLTDKEFHSMENDVKEIISILTSICKKTNKI